MNTQLYEQIQDIEDIINDTKKQKRRDQKISTEDEYTKLINKETKILKLLDDVEENRQQEKNYVKHFTSAPIHIIIFRIFKTLTDIGHELRKQKNIYEIIDFSLRKERIIYLGLFFMILSIILMFINN